MDDKTNSYNLGNNNEQTQAQDNVNMQNYMNERLNAGQVAYDNMREDAYKARVDSGLSSLSNRYDTVESPVYNPEYTPERVDSLLNSVKTREEKEASEDVPERVNIPSQPTKASSRIIDQEQIARLQNRKKKLLAALVLAGSITLVAAGINSIAQGKPEMDTSNDDWKRTEDFDSMQDVVDSVNSHKKDHIESGITTHPEHIVEESNRDELIEQAKEEKEQKQETLEKLKEKAKSNSKQEFVEEENRKKVIKIESGITTHPEHVVESSDTQGGRSY